MGLLAVIAGRVAAGATVAFRPSGSSMVPLVRSRQLVTVAPVDPTTAPPPPPVPIWIGAFKPRMLALTGRHADGWLPTNAFLDLADVPQMQHEVDLAASDAGREPTRIRRVFNDGDDLR